MIIFNLWAIPVGLMIYGIMLAIDYFYPSLTTTTSQFLWTLGVVTAGIGSICEVLGLKGRVFFVPIWMAGLATICFLLGWRGTLGFAVAFMIGVIALFWKAAKKEKADWDRVQLELIKAPAAPVDGTEAQFWNWVKGMLFLPIWMKLTPEVCEHNLKVISLLKGAKPSLSKAELEKIELLENFLQTPKITGKPMD